MKKIDLNSVIAEIISSHHDARKTLDPFIRSLDESVQGHQEIDSWIKKALMCAHLSPSNGNFQPTRLMVISHRQTKESLFSACFHDRSIMDTDYTIAVLCDKRAVYKKARSIVADDLARGAISDRESRAYNLLLDMGFSSAPFGIGKICKKLLIPIIRLCVKIPEIPILNYKSWLYKQAGITAGSFIQALNLHPRIKARLCEWFDEKRVLKALGLSPKEYFLPFVIHVGRVQGKSCHERAHILFDDFVTFG